MEAALAPRSSINDASSQNTSLYVNGKKTVVKVKKMSNKISRIGFLASMLSVVLSLYIYFVSDDKELGIFVGLWAPTLILATKEIENMLEK
tara:strand:+ start:28 stop:300 length:273 start_codon:yes stop_codon:yes gene_type:complete